MRSRAFTAELVLVLIGCSGSEAGPPADAVAVDSGSIAPSAVDAEPAIPEEDPASRVTHMRCGDQTVVASYQDGPPPSVVLHMGTASVRLPVTVSASGARYADEHQTVVWWNKGTDATLLWKGRTSNCVALPPAD